MRWMLPLLGLCACATRPDVFAEAERALLVQDLPAALLAFDGVPVAHVRYPEARAAALTVERRLRRSHELVLQALLLRSEWQDQEALTPLRRAQAVWPKMPGIRALIAATEQRADLLGPEAAAEDDGPGVAMVEVPVAVEVPAPAPAGETAVPDAGSAPAASPDAAGPSPSPARVAPKVPPHEDPVALGLVAVEMLLGRHELEAAVVELIELWKRFPHDDRVGSRLARVLHQRALLRYGHGQLAAAIADWERVVELDPDNAVAAALLASARAEAALGTDTERSSLAPPAR